MGIYILYGCWSNIFNREQPFFANKDVTFAKLSWASCLSFAEPMLGSNASYEDSFTTCQITPNYHGSLLDSRKRAASITEAVFRADGCWLKGIFLEDLPGHPSKMHFVFRPLLRKTFAKLSRKYPYPQTPDIRGKANPRGLRVWLSKPHFWKFLETSESNVRQYQRHVQGRASRPWYLAVAKPHLPKLGCYLWSER